MTLREWIEMLHQLQHVHGPGAVLWVACIGGLPEIGVHRKAHEGRPAELVVYPGWSEADSDQ